MAGKNTAVFGIYATYAGVESCVDSLKAHGFRNTDISVLFPENVGSKDASNPLPIPTGLRRRPDGDPTATRRRARLLRARPQIHRSPITE